MTKTTKNFSTLHYDARFTTFVCFRVYVYSWWILKLRGRLSDWYRRRGVLRELIFDAEKSDDEEEYETVMQQRSQKGMKQQSVSGPLVMATGKSSRQGGLLESEKGKMKLVVPEAVVGNGEDDRTASTGPVPEAAVVPQVRLIRRCCLGRIEVYRRPAYVSFLLHMSAFRKEE